MPTYQVRVTRDIDRKYTEIDVTAPTWKEAKQQAVDKAMANQDVYFGPLPEPRIIIDPADDDEETWLVEDCA